jgi:cell division protein FtsL
LTFFSFRVIIISKGDDFVNKKKIILIILAGIFILSLGANAYLGFNFYSLNSELSQKRNEIESINKELEELKNKYDENIKAIEELKKKYAESLKAKAEQTYAKTDVNPTTPTTSTNTIAGDASGMSELDRQSYILGGIIDENGTFLDASLYFDLKDTMEKDGYKFTGTVPTAPSNNSSDSSSSNNSSSNNSSSNNSSSAGYDDGNGNWVGGVYAPVTKEQFEEGRKKMLEMYGTEGSTDGGTISSMRDWTEEEKEYYSRGGNGGYH